MYKQIPAFDLILDWANKINQTPNSTANPIHPRRALEINNNIIQLAHEISKTDMYYSNRLLCIKDSLFDITGRISPYVFG